MSERLNQVRSRITVLRQSGKIELFRAAAMMVNPHELMTQEAGVKVISRAYFKLWELLHRFKLLDKVATGKSVHLCEAPGAFVQAVRDYWTTHLHRSPSKWSTISVTLPDDLEWKSDDPVIYADIMGPNPDWLQHDVDLVTGDGGFEIEGDDKNNQELHNLTLFTAQVQLGIQMLRPGGNLVVKFFDMFTDNTKQVIIDASCHFEAVHIVKPLGSRICNSERYLVGLCKLDTVTPPTLTKAHLEQLASNFANTQITALQHALTIVQQCERAQPWLLIKAHRSDQHSILRARQGLQQIGWY